jgi:cytochrome c-type biogenesis protein CcmH/NrfG
MRTAATVSLFLLLFTSVALAQFEPSQRYSVGGLVVVPYAQNRSQMEIRLVTETEIPVGRAFLHPQERFGFSNLSAGRYYLVMNVPGYKPVRQRVDATGFDPGVGATIMLEPIEELSAPKPLYLTGQENLVDVKGMPQNSKILKFLDDAEKKLKKGAVSDARSRLESIVRETPDSYDAHQLLGSAYQKSRRYADAEKEYRAAMTLRPRSAEPLIGLGSMYLEQLDNATATPDATRSILNEARNVLSQAIQMSPDAAFAHYLLGVTYQKSASNREAETSLRRALELEPRLADAHLGLVNLYIRTNNWPAVLAELDIYLKENPKVAGREQLLDKRAQIERIVSGQVAASAQR